MDNLKGASDSEMLKILQDEGIPQKMPEKTQDLVQALNYYYGSNLTHSGHRK